ncbi:MAG: M1 family metallopeptidase [Patescibacteria group bacterium]
MKKNVRLSKNVVPTKYEIQLQPDLENFTFEGIETTTLSILKKTRYLTLHSKELEIETAKIIVNKEKVFAKKISYDEKAETATFLFSKYIPTKKIKLTIVFKGILNDKMRGFYRSKYIIKDKEYHIATTQFEATDARRAFPCFDEPAQKAIFHVSLVIPKGKTAISNTLPISVREHNAGFEIIKFSPTPKMSTYLLAFIVGDFEYIESKTKNGLPVRVFTTPGKKHQATFALDCAVKTIEFYEEYFAIPYPLPVLDMIAIPDFSFGAMENWGAITYRENALLIDEDHSSLSNKQYVALVIAHELAHQWFGNLVTMEWWTHLWLNEGFASYIEYLAIDKLFPKWDIWTQFSTNDSGVALRLDALLNTHPIEILVHHPNEIGEIFDKISYSKGASIIRMLTDYIGEKKFRDGLRYYLKKHSYKNTETVHLWKAFEKVSKKPVASIMHNWTSKPGYPVIKADIVNNKLVLSQSRFFMSLKSKIKAKDKTMWQTPVSIGNNKNKKTIFLSNKRTVIPNSLPWIKINIGESGFFRTAYGKELLKNLIKPVQKKILFPRDRLGIVRDLFALAESGDIPTNQVLKFLKAYRNEDNYTVWVELATGLDQLEQLLAKTNVKEDFNSLIVDLFSPTIKRLGWEVNKFEPHTDTLLRSLAISRLGRSGDKKITVEAKKKFSIIQKGGYISPDIRSAIYTTIATVGRMREYQIFIKKYKKEELHEEKNRIGNALGDFSDPKILALVCQFALSKNVRIQDTTNILSSVGVNPRGRDVWWNFVRKNWEILTSRYGDGNHTLAKLIKAITRSAEKKHSLSFKKFFTTHNAPGAKRSVEQVIEQLEANVVWLKRDKKIIEKFLKNKKITKRKLS